jgi:hypothetical protein
MSFNGKTSDETGINIDARAIVESWDAICRGVEALEVAIGLGHRIKVPNEATANQLLGCLQIAMAHESFTALKRHHEAMEGAAEAIVASIDAVASAMDRGRGPTQGEMHYDKAVGCTDEALEMLGATEHALSVAQAQVEFLKGRVVMVTELLVEAENCIRECTKPLEFEPTIFLLQKIRTALMPSPRTTDEFMGKEQRT